MAGPLGWFRRNQKAMLIFFGAILMAVFGLGPVVDRLVSSGYRGEREDTVVVEWDGGSFTSSQLYEMRFKHFQTIRFLSALQQLAREDQNLQPRARMISTMQSEGPPQLLDRQAMQRYLLAHRAEQLGIEVGDAAVLDYLQALSGNDALTQQDFEQVVRNIWGGGIDWLEIKEQLKKELAIDQMNSIVQVGFPGVPNISQAWNEFQKLNKQIECAVIKYPVQDYLAQVTETPSESELREIYESGKYRYPNSVNDKPGFKTRRKLAVTMLTANFEDFIQRQMQKITPEQIQAEYDRLAKEKNSRVMELVPEEPEKNPEVMPTDPNREKPPELKSGEGATDKSGGDSVDVLGQESAEKSKSTESSDDKKKQDDKKQDDKSKDKSQKNDNGKEDKGDGLTAGFNEIHFVSTVLPTNDTGAEQQDKQQKEDQQKSDDKSGETKQEQNTGDPKRENQDDKSEAVSPPGHPGSAGDNEQEGQQAVQIDQDEPDTKQPQDSGLNLDDLNQQPQRRVRPLDEALSKEIRRMLATAPANQAMDSAISDARLDVEDYWGDYIIWRDTKDLPAGQREPEPDPVDFREVAAKRKLNYRSAELVDNEQLLEHPIGKTNIRVSMPPQFPGMPSQELPVPVANHLFDQFHELEEFRPETVVEYQFGNESNQHILFVTEKVDPQIPSFDDARPEVEQFWRTQAAIELAKNKARQLAEQVNSTRDPIVDKYADEAVVTGEFSWYSGMLNYQLLPGNIQPGEEFMQTAFELEPNQAGVAISGDRKDVCLIQKLKDDPRTEQALQQEFFTALSSNQGMPAAVNRIYGADYTSLMRRWFEDMEEELNIRWLTH